MARQLEKVIPLTMLMLALASCSAESELATPENPTLALAELHDRSFRKFDPDVDASPRRGVILKFSADGQISLWAQYAQDGHAIHEWEIVSQDHLAEFRGNELVIHLNAPSSTRQFPNPCEDCIETRNVSIWARNVSEKERIAFRLDDPNGVLPSPFPVFESCTRFSEDERIY